MNKYEDLKIWIKAMDLVELVYELMKEMPADEIYGLTSQIKRCSVSIPSNIAEGAGRNYQKRICSFFKYSERFNNRIRNTIIISSKA